MTKDIQHSFSQDKMHIVMRNTDCPNCEYHRKRAQLWRDEAYKQAGHPLPEREWVGLTDEERHELVRVFLGYYKDFKTTDAFIMRIERLMKEKNT